MKYIRKIGIVRILSVHHIPHDNTICIIYTEYNIIFFFIKSKIYTTIKYDVQIVFAQFQFFLYSLKKLISLKCYVNKTNI
jgi:hypothetical protein